MKQVYTRATSVVVWLGALTPQTQAFMVNFPVVMASARKMMLNNANNIDLWQGVTEWPPQDHLFWPGLFHLLNDTHFRRLWTFQEIVLAIRPILLCGSLWINMDDFIEFVVNGYFSNGAYIPFNEITAANVPGKPSKADLAWVECQTIQQCKEVIQFHTCIAVMNIPWILNKLRSRQGKEPVDRIWAISGLLGPKVQEMLNPMVDYSESGRKHFWKTYARFTRTLMAASETIALFCIPRSIEERHESVPSWCPSLSGRPACSSRLNDFWNHPVNAFGQSVSHNLQAEEDDEERSEARYRLIDNHPLKSISTTEDDKLLRVSTLR